MTTPQQLRAGRALLGISQAAMADMVNASTKTIRRAETEGSEVSDKTIEAIRAALEASGVEFIEENGGGPGVRLRK